MNLGDPLNLAVVVGWDWADESHQVSMLESGGTELERSKVGGTPEELHRWAERMLERFGEQPIGICIEDSRGAVIAALSRYPGIVFYPVNPKSAAAFREGFNVSGKKDDPTDADILCLILASYQAKLRALQPLDDESRALGILSEHRRKLVDERTRVTNRLRAVLKGYFPQALELVGELKSPMAIAFLTRWSCFESLRRAQQKTVITFYRSHNSRSRERLEERLALIRTSRSLTQDHVLIETGRIQLQSLLPLLSSLNEAIDMVEEKLEQHFKRHADRDWVLCLPGVAKTLGPRLLAILGTDRDRYETRAQLPLVTGIAPVTKQSGKSSSVHRRWRRAKFHHQTIVEWASQARLCSPWAQNYYAACIDAGKSHNVALRALGHKLLRILFTCWKERVPYDENRHQRALLKSGSPHAIPPA